MVYKEKGESKIVSQLSKYYLLAEKGDKENGIGGYNKEEIYCFIIKPDYHTLSLDKYYLPGEYKPRNYSAIHTCFKAFIEKNNSNDYPYLVEFTKALDKHTRATDDEFRNEMLKRMNKVISSKNK